MEEFVHLHVHSEYSLLDGAARIDDLVTQAAALGQKALALTDHGCMYGVVAFYKACKRAGIKPIIGMEAYVAPRSLTDKQGKMDKEYAHLILLAKNQQGYQNLMKLSSAAFVEGYYYRPRIDYDLLERYGDGLIVMSACLSGDLPRLILDNRLEDALAFVKCMQKRFGEDFYIEIQDHGIEEERQVLGTLLALCEQTGVKPVCTNDVHYVLREDAEAQDALLCIQTGRFVDEENRMRMTGSEFYLKSGDEMARLFAQCPEALLHSLEIARKCQVDFEFGKIHLPNYDVPGGYTHEAYLRELCLKGLEKKCAGKGGEYAQRLDYELGVISQMGYTDYFLIVWDFIDYAKQNGIVVGPGRGSAAGSLAAYCLDITEIDPIQYNLLFERFLNPERISMPDIDIDFCYERRQEVIDYVVHKYGADHVAQIITFGTMGAKQAVRDVGRVLRVPYGEVDKLSKMIPFELGMTIERALQTSRELRETYEAGGELKKVIDLAKKIEGMPRHASTHAAGVVICAKPVVEYVPLQRNDEAITTQFPMGTIEELGLLKMDFLGLRTLTVIRDTLDEIERLGETPPDLETISLDDQNVYRMMGSGDTDGVFQFESGGMRAFLQQFRPDCFEDIVAGVALYRPGPMDFIPQYVRGKYHPDTVRYTHPMLEPILNMTYGCIVYQEQVMQIVRDLAGYSLGRSDLVRRAMSKKKKDVMEKEESSFVEGCAKNDIDEKSAQAIFASMMDFAQYAFNKSHAAAYAMVAYRTAWLKTYHPAEFFASLMNSFLGYAEKITEYIHTCRKSSIPLWPPDINKSTGRFGVEQDGNGQKGVRFGLAAVRNVGVGACESVAREREENGSFTDFHDFVSRCGAFVNKRMLEYLIKAGAFDSMGYKRSVLVAVHTVVHDAVIDDKKRNIDGQVSLFDLTHEAAEMQTAYPDLPEYPSAQRLSMEKEATGLYISGHPLSDFETELRALPNSRDLLGAGETGGLPDEARVRIGGIIASVRYKLTRKSDQMAYVVVEDLLGQFECVVFPSVLQKRRALLQEDRFVIVSGRINVRDDDNVLILDDALPLEKSEPPHGQDSAGSNEPAQISPGLYLRCKRERMPLLLRQMEAYPGDTRVVFVCDGKAFVPQGFRGCALNESLLAQMRRNLGADNVKCVR